MFRVIAARRELMGLDLEKICVWVLGEISEMVLYVTVPLCGRVGSN